MSPSDSDTTLELLIGRLARISVEPAAVLTDPEQRRRARLLAAVLMLGAVGLAGVKFYQGSRSPVMWGAVAALLATYALSRTRHYAVAREIAIALTAIVPLAAVALVRRPDLYSITGGLIWLAYSIVLTSLLVSPLRTILTAAAVMLILLTLVALLPHLTLANTVLSMGFDASMAVLAIAVATIHHRDRAELRQQADQLAENEGRYRQLIDHSPEAIGIHADGKVVYANQAGLKLVGADRLEAVAGRPILDFVHPDYRQATSERVARLYRGESSAEMMEETFLRLDGTPFDVEVAAMPITFDGKPATQVLIRDVTERKRAKEALRDSEEKYRTIIETIDDGYFEVDPLGRLNFWNHALERISGYPADELAGKRYREYVAASSIKPLRTLFREVWLGGDTDRRIEIEIIRKNGTRSYVEASISLKRDEDGQPVGFRGIARDVTERRLADEALQAAYEALQEVDQMKDQMIQNISHEFRTPLTYVVSYVDLLLNDPMKMGVNQLSDVQRNSLEVVAEQAQRIKQMVDSFFIMQRANEDQLKRHPTPVEPLLAQAVRAAEMVAAREDIDLQLEVAPNLPPALIDKDAMRQVIDHLIANAIKFTPGGGQVTVKAWPEQNRIQVAVRDTGVGIPDDVIDHVFERFYQVDGSTRRRFGGLGLGLAICKEVIEAHGETISVTSSEGQGATFTFGLPVA